MGRIKTRLTKRIALQIYKTYRDRLKTNFEDNKQVVSELTDVSSNKIRNIIAGYVTRLAKKKVDY